MRMNKEQLIEALEQAISYMEAYGRIASRSDEANEYCQLYLMPDAWGNNIWHAILDDVLKLRKENTELKEKLIRSK